MTQFLLSSAIAGAGFLIFSFFICFIAVHTVRLAVLGWKYGLNKQRRPSPKKDKDPPIPSAPAPAKPPTPEPVYYIVERKRKPKKRVNSEYSEPKQIKFQ
ncbi:MAG: hypothetical protein IIX01_04595 [Clostridia bacterium]|nr:hypothetical protein [Clostridia bacterium]